MLHEKAHKESSVKQLRLLCVQCCVPVVLHYEVVWSHLNDDATHCFIYPFFQQHIASGATCLTICSLMGFKMTSAPEHLPPEYSVSTSLCLLLLGAWKRLHYALQEIS